MKLVLQSPAKLNLVLDVLGKRTDGFHELRTIFERIDLSDTITLEDRHDGTIKVVCAHPHVPKGPTNLVVRVTQQLRQTYSIKSGVTITIEKRIPVAAGLAGGSSNAATVLMGLNRLWHLKLSQQQLIDHAAVIGSDVAFFIHNVPYALGIGRGEQIEVMSVRTKLWHVLVTPKVKLLTKDVFRALNAPLIGIDSKRVMGKKRLTSKRDNVNILLPFLRKGKLAQIGLSLANDLEPAILSLRPDFCFLKEKLKALDPMGVCFSGSGPSVYALASSKEHAEAIKAKFDKRYVQVFVVSTLI